jgi:LacI family transcriptional regulator
MGKKTTVTLKQIAELTGFSQASISMILNKRPDVSFSEETVRLVHSTAKKLGYEKKVDTNRNKQSFGENLVAVLCPNISNPYYSTLVQSIEQAAAEKDFRVMTLNTYRSPDLEAKYLSLLEGLGIDGIIFTIAPRDSAILTSVVKSVPSVVIGDKGGPLNIDTVEMDNYSASVLIARHLISLGHKQVAYVSTTLDPSNGIRLRRLQGLEDTFRLECPNGKVLVRSRNISPNEERQDMFVEHAVGWELTKECLANKDITAIVAVNDMVAYGAIDAIVEAGLSVPKDYSVCGFDNIFPSRLSPISLTTADNYIVDKGHNAFSMLYARMDGAKTDNAAPNVITRVEYPPHLVVRSSTARARD